METSQDTLHLRDCMKDRNGDTENGYTASELIVFLLVLSFLSLLAIGIFAGNFLPVLITVAVLAVVIGGGIYWAKTSKIGEYNEISAQADAHIAATLKNIKSDTEKTLPTPTSHRKLALANLRKRYDETVLAIGSYETDPALAIDFPAFNDIAVPEVSSMVKAMKRANDLLNFSFEPGQEDLDASRQAVADFEVSFQVAKRAAEKLAWSDFTVAEQKNLKQARSLLHKAMDPASTAAERHTFRNQLIRAISRINRDHGASVIPSKALLEVEAANRREITQAPAVSIDLLNADSRTEIHRTAS